MAYRLVWVAAAWLAAGCAFALAWSQAPRALAGSTAVGLQRNEITIRSSEQMTSTLYLPAILTRAGGDQDLLGLIPANSFQMGCDSSNLAETCYSDQQPLHTVTLDAYSIDKYEVTNARYQACVAAGGCTAPGSVDSTTRSPYYGTSTYADYPVIQVNWHQASAFCAWAGRRLPTEAEWEKAARGSSDTRTYPWGSSVPDCVKLNYRPASGACVGDTSRVGSYPSGMSPYGVLDMAGNVHEWVNDWYDGSYYSVSPGSNPQGPATGEHRVLRGGSWSFNDNGVRSAFRYGGYPDNRISLVGFRCVRSQ